MNFNLRRYGKTALHYACAAGERSAAQVLIEHGADPQCKDALGATPMGMCAAAAAGGSTVHKAIIDDLGRGLQSSTLQLNLSLSKTYLEHTLNTP